MQYESGGTPQRSFAVYPVEPRRAQPPGAPPTHRADSFTGTQGWGDYDPSSSPDDPHDEPFTDIGADIVPPDAAPVPSNIVDDGHFDVAADFGGGYDAGEIPDNIVV